MEFIDNRIAILLTIITTFSIITTTESKAITNSYDSESLSSFFRDRATDSVPENPRTGTLYGVSLPANFTGMKSTVVRLRTGRFRTRGANISSITIPPNVVPIPTVKRLAIVYEDLGNWSSLFYAIPNYTLIAPVIGFTVYDSPGGKIAAGKVKISVRGRPISIKFGGEKIGEARYSAAKCVRFGEDGRFEIGGDGNGRRCVTRRQGRFSIVVPSEKKKKKRRYLKWWLIGFGGGFVGIVLSVVIVFAICKGVKNKRLRAMEKESQNGVSFGTFWVGGSAKLPSASMVRTQPGIDDVYVL